MTMSQRLLKTVRLRSLGDNDLLKASQEVTDIEIWSSRSKVVNENLESLNQELTFLNIVNPALLPIWSIIDKPYNVYTSNLKTLEFFQKLANHSDMVENVVTNAILSKISSFVHLLFYIEKTEDIFAVKCLLLDLNFYKLKEILKDGESMDTNHFIDEQVNEKEDLIDTLLRQRNANFARLNNKAQATLNIKEQQLKRSAIKQSFKKMITSEVRRRMGDKPKPLQTEVADICFKSATFKYRELLEMDEKMRGDILKWLHVLMSTLGV